MYGQVIQKLPDRCAAHGHVVPEGGEAIVGILDASRPAGGLQQVAESADIAFASTSATACFTFLLWA